MIHSSLDLGELLIDVSEDNDNSNSMDFSGWRAACRSITIFGPGALTAAIKVQVSWDGTNWVDLQSAGADIAIPADGAVVIQTTGFKYLRVSGTNEGADRTFKVMGEDGE